MPVEHDQWIDLERTATRYRIAGAGEVDVVLIHEMGGTLETWHQAAGLLGESHTSLYYDLRGFGQAEKIHGDITTDELADDLHALLIKTGVKGPVHLAGCAVGAGVAATFCAKYPIMARSLTMLSPALGVPAAVKEERLLQTKGIVAGGMRAIVEASLSLSYPEVLRSAGGSFDTFRARWIGNDPESFAALYRMLIRQDLTDTTAAISCPVLCLAGEHDALRPPAYVEDIARSIPSAIYTVIKSGHHMPYQTPELVAGELSKFMNTIGKRKV